MDPEPFKPIPVALCERIQAHARSLAQAQTEADAVRALFLCFSELKDAEKLLPSAVPVRPTPSPL
jgi:hypothetical protein